MSSFPGDPYKSVRGLQRPVNLGFHRPDRTAGHFRDFPKLEILESAQDQDLALLPRQAVERPPDQRGFLSRLEEVFGSRRGGWGIRVLILQRQYAFLLPQVIDMGVPGDLEHPDGELVRSLVAGPVLENARENVLDQVFADAPVARQAEEEVEEQDMMSLEEDGQLFHLSVPDGFHQVVVVRCHGFRLFQVLFSAFMI